MLAELLSGELKGRIAAVSSFGTESAVLLHMIAAVDRDVPVIFTNTQKMFGETLESSKLLSFVCIWAALFIYSLDIWLGLRRRGQVA